MTQQELDALKALADAATPGPWVCYYSLSVGATVQQNGRAGWIFRAQEKATREDMDFVAAARAAVPALIAEVERLRVAWSAEHDACIRADEQARMARREVERLRAELAAARNLTMDVRRADNGDVVISVE